VKKIERFHGILDKNTNWTSEGHRIFGVLKGNGKFEIIEQKRSVLDRPMVNILSID